MVRLAPAKAYAAEMLPTDNLGRELLLNLPDELRDQEFDTIFPTIVRLLRVRTDRDPRFAGRAGHPADAGPRGGDADGGGDDDL